MSVASLRAAASLRALSLPAACGGAGPHTAAAWSAGLCLPAILLALSAAASEALAYDRELLDREPWRLVTGHWTHWGFEHLIWDVLAFGMLLATALATSVRRTAVGLIGACVLIPAVLYVALPEMASYRGLSGLDSALFVMLAATLLRRAARARDCLFAAVCVLALGAFGGKVAYELWAGTALFVNDPAFVPVPLAHLIGGGVGALAGGISRRAGRRPRAS